MGVIYCYYILDAAYLSEQVRTRDILGLNVNYFQPPVTLPQDQ